MRMGSLKSWVILILVISLLNHCDSDQRFNY